MARPHLSVVKPMATGILVEMVEHLLSTAANLPDLR
jgi:hypothetical protein